MFIAVIFHTASVSAYETIEVAGTTRDELLRAARAEEEKLGCRYRLTRIVYKAGGRDVTIWRDNRWLDAALEVLDDPDEPML